MSAAAAVLTCMLVSCHREKAASTTHTTAGEPAPPSTLAFPTPPVLPGTPDVPALVAKVRMGVVNITTTQETKSRGPADPFEFFFGRRGPGNEEVQKRRALGSGFIVDQKGHVATNGHVVAGASSVRVTLADGRELSAKVKGSDDRLDVAVLELENARDLPFVALGSSDATKVGEYVVAIGNPFGLGDTVTMGIVSAKGRELGAGPYDDFIQTDASINPGNSGGPLFNLRGEVIGINTAINPEGRGIGFAIPIDALKEVLPQLENAGTVERGRLGAVIQPIDADLASALGLPKAEGALVNEVEPGGPAAKAGIEPGEVILSVDKTPITHASELPRVIARHRPGAAVALEVMNKAKGKRTVNVTLQALKDEGTRGAQIPSEGQGRQGLGIVLMDDPRGVVVGEIDPNSPAADVLQPGDVILEVDGAHVQKARDAAERVRRAGDRAVMLKVVRNGRARFVAIRRR
jgi:serine protease Do